MCVCVCIIDMFFVSLQHFYKNLRGQCRTEATWSIKEHAKRTCKKMMNEKKRRFVKKKEGNWEVSKRAEAEVFSSPSMGKLVEVLG